MKKIVLSLLALAATMNIMAVTYSAKATVTLESQDSYESCQMIIAQSSELAEGLTSGEYAEINPDRAVGLYVEFGGVKYQHFASNPNTVKNLTLGAITDAATTYTLTISEVSGSETMQIKIGDEVIDLVAGTHTITLTPNQTTGAAIGTVNPAGPVAKSFCFRNNILEINGYKDDANVKIDDAAVAITSDNFTREFTAAEAGRHKLTIDGKDYLFDAFPSNVTPVVP